MLGKFKDFVFSDLLGVKIDAKKGDVLGNLKVFVLGVGCLGWGAWESKINMMRIGFVTDFYGSMLTLKSAFLVVNSRFLHTQCVTFQIPENCEVEPQPGRTGLWPSG